MNLINSVLWESTSSLTSLLQQLGPTPHCSWFPQQPIRLIHPCGATQVSRVHTWRIIKKKGKKEGQREGKREEAVQIRTDQSSIQHLHNLCKTTAIDICEQCVTSSTCALLHLDQCPELTTMQLGSNTPSLCGIVSHQLLGILQLPLLATSSFLPVCPLSEDDTCHLT